jgi:hypothetical protein
MGTGSTDVQLVVEPAEGTRRTRLTVLLGAAGVALTLLAGIGVVVGWRLLSGGPAPADSMPASVAAYAAVDFAPAPDQEAWLVNLAGKLPHSGTTSGGHAFDPGDLIRSAVGDHPGVDVGRDITSWLGVRFGVAAWRDPHGHPYVLVAAASRDDEAARSGLARLRAAYPDHGVGYVVGNHLALVAVGDRDAQAAAESAKAEGATHPLTSAPAFVDATRWLDGPQVVLAWLDNARYRDFTRAQSSGQDGLFYGGDPLGSATGHLVLGVRASADGLTARFRSSGTGTPTAPVPDALSRLGTLPGDSAVAAVARIPAHLEKVAGNLLDPVSVAFGLFFTGMIMFAVPMAGPPAAHQLSDAQQRELDALMSKDPAKLTPAEHKRIAQLLGFDPTVGGPPPFMGGAPGGPSRVLTDAEQREVEALLAKDPSQLTPAEHARLAQLLGGDPTRLTGPGPDHSGALPGDPTEPLSGAAVTLAVSGFGATPTLKATVEATSADQAHQLAATFGGRLTTTTDGSTVTATSPGYTGGGGRLADQPLFRKAVAGSPTDVFAAVFVDLRRAVPAGQRDKLGGLLAVSLVVGADHGDQAGTLRLLV